MQRSLGELSCRPGEEWALPGYCCARNDKCVRPLRGNRLWEHRVSERILLSFCFRSSKKMSFWEMKDTSFDEWWFNLKFHIYFLIKYVRLPYFISLFLLVSFSSSSLPILYVNTFNDIFLESGSLHRLTLSFCLLVLRRFHCAFLSPHRLTLSVCLHVHWFFRCAFLS